MQDMLATFGAVTLHLGVVCRLIMIDLMKLRGPVTLHLGVICRRLVVAY